MVSLKDLPYEFVFLHKPASSPSMSLPAHTSTPTPSQSTMRSLQLTYKSKRITRESKPEVSISVHKARVKLVRGISFKIRNAIRHRNYLYHQHSCHKRIQEDWRHQYQVGLGKTMQTNRTFESRNTLRNTMEEKAKKMKSPYFVKYFRKMEEREQRKRDR